MTCTGRAAASPTRPWTWTRQVSGLALSATFAAGCAIVAATIPGSVKAAMTEDACQRLPPEELVSAVDQGLCTLDVLPAAGPPPLLAESSGTAGEQNGDGDGPQVDGPDGGGTEGGGSSGGDDSGSGSDDGGSVGGDDGGSVGGDDGGSVGGDDGGVHGNNGFGNGGQDGSPNGRSDATR